MEQKVVKQLLSIIDEKTLKKIFNSFVIKEKIKINGFSSNKTDTIPKTLYIQSLLKDIKDPGVLVKQVVTNYPHTVDYSKYKDLPFSEAKNIINDLDMPLVLANYLLGENNNEEKEHASEFLSKLIEDSKVLTVNSNIEKEVLLTNSENNIKESEENKILDLTEEIRSLRIINKEYKSKADVLKKENNENKKLVKQLTKELSDNVEVLNNNIESKKLEIINLKNSLNTERDNYKKLKDMYDESMKKLEEMTFKVERFISNNKVGILYDYDIKSYSEDICIVTKNNINILLNNFESFKKIYILERSVTESIRRKLLIKQKKLNKEILEFVSDEYVIEELVKGAKNNGQ